ncbi:MAG: lipopolysaccharide biosynthesis protein [Acidobacteriaceae bacterium]
MNLFPKLPALTQKSRLGRVAVATVSSIGSRGISIAVSAISIPLTVRYLGAEMYGVWVTIGTTLAMLAVMDLGIGNTLTNSISEAYALGSKQLAGLYTASAFWMMFTLALFLGVIGYPLWRVLNFGSIFNIHNPFAIQQSRDAVGVAYLIFLLGLPVGLINKILGGYQQLQIANYFSVAGAVLSLFAIVATTYFRAGLVVLVLAYSGSLLLTDMICMFWLFLSYKPWLFPSLSKVHLATAKQILSFGGMFFLLQLSGLVVFNSDNLVIAHFMGPRQVTPYNVTWRLVGYAGILQNLVMPALWPAYSEAIVRGDATWVRSTYRRTMWVTMLFASAFCLVFLFLGRPFIRIWASSAAVPSEGLLIAMCVWTLISTMMNNEATLLVAANEIRLQTALSLVAAAVNLFLSIILVQRIGAIGVILGTIVSYILVLIGPQTWKTTNVLKNLKSDESRQLAHDNPELLPALESKLE